MIKRFPSRNNRSKGMKVKHVLQIILLLGVCFWLIYQVKHNHDKKKEFDKNDAKLSARTEADHVLNLGRRGLHPGKVEINQNEKHEEEEEDENIGEDEENKPDHNEQEDDGNKHETEESEENQHEVGEQGDEENKLGAEEQEEDENKSEEMEDEGRGGGDDEIDENEQEKSAADTDRDEEFMDEEKEKEEGDDKDSENSEEEKGDSVGNHNTHEAREEHYKGDDASSAVAHDAHSASTETDTVSLENSDVNLEMNITKPENKTTYLDESNRNQNNSDFKVPESELADRTSSNTTAGKEIRNNSWANPEDSTGRNKTATANSDIHLEASRNVTAVITEASNNMTGAGADTLSSSEQNKTVMLSESDHAQNIMVNTIATGDVKNATTDGVEQSSNRVAEENQHDTDSTASVKTENGDVAARESSYQGAGELEKAIRFVASNETNNSTNLNRKESSDASRSDKSYDHIETNETQKADATEDEMFKGDTKTVETDETSDSFSANEHVDSIDSSDSHIHEDVAEVRTDLDTLPDTRNEGDHDDEIAEE